MGSYPEHERRDLKDPILINELISSLKGSKVLTPDSDGYAEGIKRWSEASEKPAVGGGPSSSSTSSNI